MISSVFVFIKIDAGSGMIACPSELGYSFLYLCRSATFVKKIISAVTGKIINYRVVTLIAPNPGLRSYKNHKQVGNFIAIFLLLMMNTLFEFFSY